MTIFKYFFPYFNKGGSLKLLKKNDEAIKAFDQAIAINPSSYLSYNGKITILNELNKQDDCLNLVDDILKQSSVEKYKYLIYTQKGEALLSLGRYQEALDAFCEAILYDKLYGNAYVGGIKALEKMNRFGHEMHAFYTMLESGKCHLVILTLLIK